MTKKRIKAVFKCKEEFKKQFKNSKCLLTISVGQEVHEDEKFLATIDLINSSFASCTICVDDSLQRHSLSLQYGKQPEDWYQASIDEGDSWLERNKYYYSLLKIPYKIIRWDKWITHKEFFIQQQLIKNTYETNQNYKNAIDSSVKEFLDRYQKRLARNQQFDYKHGFRVCKDYLLEECTALCLWATEEYNFEVYPSKRNDAMSMTHTIFIKPTTPNLVNAVAIKFKNRKQLKPQIFLDKERQCLEKQL
jgi:hypothetical protein